MKGLDGALKCDEHKVSFNTPTEFYEHEKEIEHSHTGETLCTDCLNSGIKKKAECDPESFGLGRPTPRCIDCNDRIEKEVLAKIEARKKK